MAAAVCASRRSTLACSVTERLTNKITAFPTTAGTSVQTPFGPPDLVARMVLAGICGIICGGEFVLTSRNLCEGPCLSSSFVFALEIGVLVRIDVLARSRCQGLNTACTTCCVRVGLRVVCGHSTNYPQWYPFDPIDANMEYRFRFNFQPPATLS